MRFVSNFQSPNQHMALVQLLPHVLNVFSESHPTWSLALRDEASRFPVVG